VTYGTGRRDKRQKTLRNRVERPVIYSSWESRVPSVGLYFFGDFSVFGVSRRVGRGDPITFRAADFTAVAALNVLRFLVRFAIS